LYCTEDAQLCPDDKTWVSRDPLNNCQFKPCVGENEQLDLGGEIYCTEDVQLCPDGKTWVSRDPQNKCQFKPCPDKEDETIVQDVDGNVTQLYCTEDAQMCPDGVSWVGRDPLNDCQFKPCPDKEDETIVQDVDGNVTQLYCTEDAQVCPDGETWVGRDLLNDCQFKPCPDKEDNEMTAEGEDEPVQYCPQDGKMCPDGVSWVGRDPQNNCQFELCSEEVEDEPTAEVEERPVTGDNDVVTEGEQPCTKDIRQCPGSDKWVSRDPHTCEFMPCPGETDLASEGDSETVQYCPEDAKMCPDGETWVSRDPQNDCQFEICSSEEDEPASEGEDEPASEGEDEPASEGEGDLASEGEDALFCTEDAQLCPDGETWVGRDPLNNCQFEPCPDKDESTAEGENDLASEGEDEPASEGENQYTPYCPEDTQLCSDGVTWVSRDHYNSCQFEACPSSEGESESEEDVRRGGGLRGTRGDGKDKEVVAGCSQEVKSCDDHSVVYRNPDKCCLFFPCPGEGMMDKIERKVQEMACEATLVKLRKPGE